jgi:hypothetical protein
MCGWCHFINKFVANKNHRIMKFNLYKSILFGPAIMGLTAMQAQTTKEERAGYQYFF